MRALLCRAVVVGLGIALVGALPCRAPAQIPPPREQPRDQGPRMPPDVQAAGLLHQAYDTLNLMRLWMGSDRVKLPEAQARLADQAEDLYRRAHEAYKSRDYGRATPLAAAAFNGSHGLLSTLHANTRPLAGLPAPPDIPTPPDRGGADAARGVGGSNGQQGGGIRSPQEAAREALKAAREEVVAADKAAPDKGPGRAFVDASRSVYEQGRQAYQGGDYNKAMDLAEAAEAWARVGEDLRHAEGGSQPGPGR